MGDIKLITKYTDLSKVKLEKIEWDAWYKITPLDVYRIPGFVHSIGGGWGENNYWCCKRGVNPNHETLMEFNGAPCQWSYSLTENNYYKYKYDEKSIEKNYIIKILRNNDVFYSFSVNNMDFGINKVRLLLFEINEHPINFHFINYKDEIIGREIMWHKVPAVIKDYSSINGSLMIVPDLNFVTLEDFFKKTGCCNEEENDFIMEDLFAESITWFNFLKGQT